MPVVGQLLEWYRDPLALLLGLARDYGDVVRFRLGPWDAFLVNHPDSIKELLARPGGELAKGRVQQRTRLLLGEGLLTSAGELHRRQRRRIGPAFARDRLADYGAAIVEHGARARARWREGATVDVAREMGRLTTGIAARTLLDADLEGAEAELGRALDAAARLVGPARLSSVALRAWLPFGGAGRFRATARRLDAAVYRLVDARRAEAASGRPARGELFGALLGGRGDGPVGRRQVRDEVVTFLLTGSETVTAALTWSWYLLARHPREEAALHAELDAALAGRLPTVDDLPRLPYTRAVLAEAMRRYPPIWVMTRRALVPCPVGPYVLPAGANVVLSQYAMHHDPRYYPDPFRFDPARWTPERQAERPRFSYFPFGGGPRQCIGEAFAWTEGVLLLATLAQAWRPRLAPGRPVELQPRITLRPKGGLPMIPERRRPAARAAD